MSDQYLAVLKAVYDYDPQSEDEVQIKEGQILFLLERTDDDWWKIKQKADAGQDPDAPVGLVPAAYVEQAGHKSEVKALYDYAAAAPGELSIKEDDIFLAFDLDDEWLLVQSTQQGKAGYVPASYVEEYTAAAGDSQPASVPVPSPALVIPDSPPKPSAPYVDPAERVAASKATSDDIKTWSVTHIDAKSKKKKGTLGVGNGAVFFASESDKTPVQKWQTADVSDSFVEKGKHIHVTIQGPNPTDLHFAVASKDIADAIHAKLTSSRTLARAKDEPPPSGEDEEHQASLTASHAVKQKPSVHFSSDAPVIIPPREPSDDDDEEDMSHINGSTSTQDGERAVALYDFVADGDDELSVSEGEQLLVIEKDGDEWWKCRNSRGKEGVVPASYIEVAGAPQVNGNRQEVDEDEDDDGEAERQAAAAQAAAEAARQQREAEEKHAKEKERARALKEKAEKEKAEREKAERAEKERRRQEAQKQAEAAEAARSKRKEEARQRAKAASPPARPVSSPPESNSPSLRDKQSSSSKNDRPSSSSMEGSKPSPDKVRVWHDRSGQFRVEAAFLGFNGGKLRLHKVNGVIVEVPSEKMSVEDMKYVEKLAQRDRERQERNARRNSEDDVPLAVQRRRSQMEQQKKKGPQVDWFDFFLNAGCDIDDCTRYAAAFDRDKIDVAILGDITDSTMRSLGLREGDIIRVTKHIKEKFTKKDPREEQIRADEKLARELQGKESQPAPNLFSKGPDGALKAPRRGRPTPSSSTPPATVDLISLSAASDQIPRTGSPPVVSPAKSGTPVPAINRPGSSTAKPGFEDDAWTNRPSSTKPTSPKPTSPPAQASQPITTPPATQPPAPAPPPAQPAPAVPSASTSPSLAKTTESDIFDQLARLSELRKAQSPQQPSSSPSITTPPQVAPNPTMFANPSPGMGTSQHATPMGQVQITPSPSLPQPMGQMQQMQLSPSSSLPQSLMNNNGPRGPFAPIPANEGLLRPLIPTHTGFTGFVPTRPGTTGSTNISPFAGGVPAPPLPQQNSFLASPFPNGTLAGQSSGFQGSLMSQPTGVPMGNLSPPHFVQSNPTGLNAGFGQPSMNYIPSPPPVPPASPPGKDTSPANVFAQMKSGTFATDNASDPQAPDRYDALRPNPIFTQPTGFYGGYR